MTRLTFGQAKCAKCKESNETLKQVDLPTGDFVLCVDCRRGEFKKIALTNIRKGISHMQEMLDIHLKKIAPYSLDALNQVSVGEFVTSTRQNMLFVEEWLRKYEEIDKKMRE